jgi:transposase-like protein
MSRSTYSEKSVKRQRSKQLAGVIGGEHRIAVSKGVHSYLQSLCMEIIKGLMQGELETLCGPRYEHATDRQYTRHGYQQGSIVVADGGKEAIERPRARSVHTGQEATLDIYNAFSNKRVLDERALALISAGVSSRQFERTLTKNLRRHGVSASAVSRRVIRSAQASLEHFEQRQWDKTHFVALLFDGVRVGKVMVVACVGVDLGGRKHVLAVHPGATENARVCRDLIRKLVEKKLDVDGNYLFVLDGSKALRCAITERFGKPVIQRCQEHKIRDVQAYLPLKHRDEVRKKLQAAYNTRSYKEASKRLQDLRLKLCSVSEQATSSLTEGLEDSLTLHRLGIWGGLKDSLRTTNIIESTFSTLRDKTRNVKNWQDEPQVNRWMAHGLLQIEQRYRKVPGHRTLTRLKCKLEQAYTAANKSIENGGGEQC